ncbi:MAG: ACP S-malonyltransferase [Proteobacteria bacterium]|jgi:[acyl-carrier-protein] S-malonyltransferase|nr:ACP S-malonyltransferase [Desulfocapsa sp.]MBU3945766.1 ACP S-malonyltransferase [Pseudomonadota bacterium]MCG2745412.1 ACP S-malonyltransferase [Desulfobacteraceae bacterium]MBU4030058.1 ACP S-malonyltransferase [Pseudomonadota bacterium]MBU4041925.1 ACP S-malonyltransferase [Pseudomonadota bacterium]
MKIAVLFPGQGSQYLGMGREFIETDSACAAIMVQAEAVCDFPLRQLCIEGPMEELTRAIHLQPAITVTNLICWQALQKAWRGKVVASCFAGHSLGEYSALCAAGVLSVEDTMRLVAKRGMLMEREGQKHPGAMRAVLGLSIGDIEGIIAQCAGAGVATVANYNTDQQIVISGEVAALDAVGGIAAERGAKIIPLAVSVANHSPLVADAVPDFATFMAEVEFNRPQIPVYFNVLAATEEEPAMIREVMARQIASRVRWFELIQAMIGQGVDTFIEVGPKTVLKGMIRKIAPKGYVYQALQLDTPDSLGQCLEQLGMN